MVRLTRIYTRLGDDGNTHLGDMSRASKNHPLIEAYGTVDELNAQLGVVLAAAELPKQLAELLRHIQNDLFDLGADLAVPQTPQSERGTGKKSKQPPLRVLPAQTEWLEQQCDRANAELTPLNSFILPGGTLVAAQLHVARTVCRRAERRAIKCGDDINPECVRYLNRLSDLLFILGRVANAGEEPLWKPGRYR